MPLGCQIFDIGPNLTSLLVQILVVLGTLAAAYRGQSIVNSYANRPTAPAGPST
jgi:hypothetical protein